MEEEIPPGPKPVLQRDEQCMSSRIYNDSPTGEFGDTKPEVSPAVTVRPRFDVERRDLFDLIRGENGRERASSEQPPPLVHGIVDSIDLEAHQGARSDRGDL